MALEERDLNRKIRITAPSLYSGDERIFSNLWIDLILITCLSSFVENFSSLAIFEYFYRREVCGNELLDCDFLEILLWFDLFVLKYLLCASI